MLKISTHNSFYAGEGGGRVCPKIFWAIHNTNISHPNLKILIKSPTPNSEHVFLTYSSVTPYLRFYDKIVEPK